MIKTKKQPEKVFNNNPPQREVSYEVNVDAEQKAANWNIHFTKESKRKVPFTGDNANKNNTSPGRNPFDNTIDSSLTEYNTGANRLIFKQNSANYLESIPEMVASN